MSSARIVRIIARLNVGGPAMHAVLATSMVDKNRFESTLVTGLPGATEGDMRYFAHEHGVQPIEIAELGRELNPLDDFRALVALTRLLRRERPDIVHTHTAKAGTLGRLAAILARIPVRVHTFHGHVFEGYFPPWKTALFLFIERLLARFTARILTVSTGQRQDLVSRYRVAPADRVQVIPLGLDLDPLRHCEQHRGALRIELGLAPSAPLVGIVGRFVPIKQHELFLNAARILRDQSEKEFHFLMVGSGEREAELRKMVSALGLDGRVHFLGWRRDLAKIYADLDLVALTSKNEGTPVALIEAMAAGVPVAATAVGGVPDLLAGGERGELVDLPHTPERMAAAMERQLSPEARDRARGLRAVAFREFGAERLCRDLEALYTRLLIEV